LDNLSCGFGRFCATMSRDDLAKNGAVWEKNDRSLETELAGDSASMEPKPAGTAVGTARERRSCQRRAGTIYLDRDDSGGDWLVSSSAPRRIKSPINSSTLTHANNPPF
jgi:hypothetical protein